MEHQPIPPRSTSANRHTRSLDSPAGSNDTPDQWGAEDFAHLRTAITSHPDDPTEDTTAGMRGLNISSSEGPSSPATPGVPSTTAQPTGSSSIRGVPPRTSSARRRLPMPKERRDTKSPPASPTSPTRRGPVVGHKTTRSLDLAPGDPSPLVPRQPVSPDKSSYKTPSRPPDASTPRPTTTSEFPQADRAIGDKATSAQQPTDTPVISSSSPLSPQQISPHVLLPPDFVPGHRTTTHVHTTWSPAVTAATTHRHIATHTHTPIVRHHHVHHHYTYTQPVKVTEVLPARHFRIDEHTGDKVELDGPPEGYEEEECLGQQGGQPHRNDEVDQYHELLRSGRLEPLTRHYVVDEENPQGKIIHQGSGPSVDDDGAG